MWKRHCDSGFTRSTVSFLEIFFIASAVRTINSRYLKGSGEEHNGSVPTGREATA